MKDGGLELEFDLDEQPQKVWRAISIPELRERWLPKEELAACDAVIVTPGEEVRYTLRDCGLSFVQSTVTFTITPNAIGGTRLRIVHEPADPSFGSIATGANSNSPQLMLAA